VPYYHCSGAYNDITHKHWFNKRSIYQLVSGEDYLIHKKTNKFQIVRLELIPTRLGKLFPSFIREMVSFVFGEIYSEIMVLLKVLK